MPWIVELGRPIWRVGTQSWSLDEMFRLDQWKDQMDAETALVELIGAPGADEEG